MAQPNLRAKSPLDVLQSMINGILIATGKALRASNKENGKGVYNPNTRLRGIIPSASDNFHLILDDFECEIIQAKSVLLRDLEQLRARRAALENPQPLVEELDNVPDAIDLETTADIVELNATILPPEPAIKEEKSIDSPEKALPNELRKSSPKALKAESEDDKSLAVEDVKAIQAPSPPSSTNERSGDKPIGLGIDTDDLTSTSAPATAEILNSSIDSLFEVPDNEEPISDADLTFDNMDFDLDISNSNTQQQTQDLSPGQNDEFDLSAFGEVSQEFNLDSLQTTTDNISANDTNTNDVNKNEDIFNLDNNADNTDNMDLDLDLPMAGAEDSVFEDMYFGGGDDGTNGGTEMEHEFDNVFFGLDN